MFESNSSIFSPDLFNDYDLLFVSNPELKISLDDMYFPSSDISILKIEPPKKIFPIHCHRKNVAKSLNKQNNSKLLVKRSPRIQFSNISSDFKRSSYYMRVFDGIYVQTAISLADKYIKIVLKNYPDLFKNPKDAIKVIEKIMQIVTQNNPDVFENPENPQFLNINNKVKMITYQPADI